MDEQVRAVDFYRNNLFNLNHYTKKYIRVQKPLAVLQASNVLGVRAHNGVIAYTQTSKRIVFQKEDGTEIAVLSIRNPIDSFSIYNDTSLTVALLFRNKQAVVLRYDGVFVVVYRLMGPVTHVELTENLVVDHRMSINYRNRLFGCDEYKRVPHSRVERYIELHRDRVKIREYTLQFVGGHDFKNYYCIRDDSLYVANSLRCSVLKFRLLADRLELLGELALEEDTCGIDVSGAIYVASAHNIYKFSDIEYRDETINVKDTIKDVMIPKIELCFKEIARQLVEAVEGQVRSILESSCNARIEQHVTRIETKCVEKADEALSLFEKALTLRNTERSTQRDTIRTLVKKGDAAELHKLIGGDSELYALSVPLDTYDGIKTTELLRLLRFLAPVCDAPRILSHVEKLLLLIPWRTLSTEEEALAQETLKVLEGSVGMRATAVITRRFLERKAA